MKWFLGSALFHKCLFIISGKAQLHISRTIANFIPRVESQSSKPIHCYKSLYPWKSCSEFANYLISSIVYNKHGVVAVNKPYGVRIHKKNHEEMEKSSTKNIKHTAMYSSQEDFPYSVEECLPDIKSALNITNLIIIKSTERYTSGIVLMATDEKVVAKVRKAFNIAKNKKVPHLVYWMITRGYSVEPARKETVGIKFIDIEHNQEKQPEIITNMSHRDILLKRMKPVLVEYRTISVNKTMPSSLLEICASSTKFHFLRVYASSRAASILGDHLYGSRMQTIFGRPIKINSQNAAAYTPQPLPEPMCERLCLSQSVEAHLSVPTMLHSQTIILPSFINGSDLIISAPPPKHFVWTCEQLDLMK